MCFDALSRKPESWLRSQQMAFSRHLYPKYDFVFTQCHGVVDDNRLRIHFLGFRIDAGGMGTIKELADARGIEKADKTTVSGLIELAGLDKKQSAGQEKFVPFSLSVRFFDTPASIGR
jgi:hypothetical protein